MKKLLIIFLCTASIGSFAQKKSNGIVYIEHPAIQVIEQYVSAMVAGDTTKMATFLTDDFQYFNGTSATETTKGMKQSLYLKNVKRYSAELDYFSIAPFPGSYHDAIEYNKDNPNAEVWVQTWMMIKGVHKKTGVKIDAAAHGLYKLTKDNKIKMILNYSNDLVLSEIASSNVDRTNGKIYNHHDNINTVRKTMYAFEKGVLEKAFTAYAKNATFYDINYDITKPSSLEEIKSIRQQFLNDFEIKNIAVIGYPDYLEYEEGNGRSVLSWWSFELIRKADKKKITLPMHISQNFNEEGKIVSEIIYYSNSLLQN